MGEIHELFVLALPLVWFAGATPDQKHLEDVQFPVSFFEKNCKPPQAVKATAVISELPLRKPLAQEFPKGGFCEGRKSQ